MCHASGSAARYYKRGPQDILAYPGSVQIGPRVRMAEAQQARMQSAVDEMVQGLERDHIRKMQGLMFQCSARCCERASDSMTQVHQCIERCHAPLAQAQSLVTTELERFQDRLARCTMHCNDKAKDAFESGAKEAAVRGQLERCVGGCVDEHLSLLPSVTRRLKDSLASIKQ
uniref:Protein FAM136A n=1 Tax=Lepisosteus oculatus TaxID=7918 RepID=W5NF72_LEPOC|nr:PREDICTED: protein FAM136A isoform X1 [Lepisosteus oculatus]